MKAILDALGEMDKWGMNFYHLMRACMKLWYDRTQSPILKCACVIVHGFLLLQYVAVNLCVVVFGVIGPWLLVLWLKDKVVELWKG